MVTVTYGEFLGSKLTNNIAELNAIWKGLRLVKHLKIPVRIYSDSDYSINSICGVYNGTKNRELINKLITYMTKYPYTIEFVKVKGHSGVRYNEYADSIAGVMLQMVKNKKVKMTSVKRKRKRKNDSKAPILSKKSTP